MGQPGSKGLSKDPLQKMAVIYSKPASPRKPEMARVSALRRQSQQPAVKLAAATVNRRVVGSSPIGGANLLGTFVRFSQFSSSTPRRERQWDQGHSKPSRKAAFVDEEVALVTSANFHGAGHGRRRVVARNSRFSLASSSSWRQCGQVMLSIVVLGLAYRSQRLGKGIGPELDPEAIVVRVK
jgi:hypothetical protein